MKRGLQDIREVIIQESEAIKARKKRITGRSIQLFVEGLLKKMKSIKEPESLALADLKNYRDGDTLAYICSNIPPEVVHHKFGLEFLLWVRTESTSMEYGDDCRRVFEENGYDYGLLERARLAMWRLTTNEYSVENILRLYNVLINLENALVKIQLANLLDAHATGQIKAEKYSLEVLMPESGERGYVTKWNGKQTENGLISIYLDAPVAVGLFYKDLPCAVISFLPYGDNLKIFQNQGIKPKSANGAKVKTTKGLGGFNNIRWVMLDVLKEIARLLGYNYIISPTAENIEWTRRRHKNGDLHLELKDAQRIYDNSAQTFGFKLIEEDGKRYYRLEI